MADLMELKHAQTAFTKAGYRLSALILTSYSRIALPKLHTLLATPLAAGDLDYNHIWLYECNPSRADRGAPPLSDRLARPHCSLSCKDCLADPKLPKKSFHPKVWLLRFTPEPAKPDAAEDAAPQEAVWRLVVSSKNFAQSAGSWKVLDCYYMADSLPAGDGTGETKPELAAFLNTMQANTPQTPWPPLWQELTNTLWPKALHFWFCGGAPASPPPFARAVELHVLSPFLGNGFFPLLPATLKPDHVHIYSYPDEIRRLPKACRGYHFHACTELPGDTPPAEDSAGAVPTELPKGFWFHAKMYLWREETGPWYLMLGSPNASSRAFQTNTEAAVWFPIEDTTQKQLLCAEPETDPQNQEGGVPGWTQLFHIDWIQPEGQTATDAGEREPRPKEQFQKATGDAYGGPEEISLPLQVQHRNLLREAFRRKGMKQLLEACFQKDCPDSFWNCLAQGKPLPSMDTVAAGQSAAEASFPLLREDARWQARCQDIRSTLTALQKGAPPT